MIINAKIKIGLLALFFSITCMEALASSEKHIKDLASRYDLVARVTHTSILELNDNPDKSKWGQILPINPKKAPDGAIFAGLGRDSDLSTPYFGYLYIKGRLYGYNKIYIRVTEVTGSQMRATDDNDHDFILQVVRHGSGYKRQDR
jgi:hypothetical protein